MPFCSKSYSTLLPSLCLGLNEPMMYVNFGGSFGLVNVEAGRPQMLSGAEGESSCTVYSSTVHSVKKSGWFRQKPVWIAISDLTESVKFHQILMNSIKFWNPANTTLDGSKLVLIFCKCTKGKYFFCFKTIFCHWMLAKLWQENIFLTKTWQRVIK
jgi:hypothetical protein